MSWWQNLGQGAAGGAMAGSTFGPWGTAGGAILGGLGGLLGGDAGDDARKKQYGMYDDLSKGGPQIGPAAQAGYSDFRNNQRAYISSLEAQAAGRGPSLATEQLKAATDRNNRQQIGLAQSGMGNPAAASMMAQNNIAQLGAQSAQDSAAARIQEQLNAQQLLGINLHGARGADEDTNRFNASQSNQMTQTGYQGQLENNRLRAMLLGGAGGNTGPSFSEQILAGGGGMYGQHKAMQMAMAGRKK